MARALKAWDAVYADKPQVEVTAEGHIILTPVSADQGNRGGNPWDRLHNDEKA
ncbi:MAG: hypothetical protein AAGA32_17550 [Pseudomonadota bacterium]